MKKKSIFIHGWEGYPEEGWRPWLRSELEKKGWLVINPEMPNTKNPKMTDWVNHLHQILPNPDKDCFLIGHSLGAIAILRYLESLKVKKKLGGAIFVAGFTKDLTYPGYKGELKNFFTSPLDFIDIKNNCRKFIAIHSKEDQWVSVDQVVEFKKYLNAKLKITEGMKHFSGDDGIFEAPIILESLMEIAD